MKFGELKDGDYFKHDGGKDNIFVKRMNRDYHSNAVWMTWKVGLVCIFAETQEVQPVNLVEEAVYENILPTFDSIINGRFFIYGGIRYRKVGGGGMWNALNLSTYMLANFSGDTYVKPSE